MAYEFQHSIEVGINRASAWRFWTDVKNWSLDPAIDWVKLDGPFRAGTRGTTKTRGDEVVEWRIIDVQEGVSATIEIVTPGATARFSWEFVGLTEKKARLTQQITLSGEQADVYVEQMGAGFEQGIREGMGKLRAAMDHSLL